jgi:hypothetical protein
MSVDAAKAMAAFLAGSEIADPAERVAYLDRECGDAAELRAGDPEQHSASGNYAACLRFRHAKPNRAKAQMQRRANVEGSGTAVVRMLSR